MYHDIFCICSNAWDYVRGIIASDVEHDIMRCEEMITLIDDDELQMENSVDNYPSMVTENDYGKCLIATSDIEEGIAVAKFDGTWLKYKKDDMKPIPDEVPADDINHFLIIDEKNLVIPNTSARYINHSCDPNCKINDDMEVVTMRPVKQGEELTISYNVIDKKWIDATWDSRWDFICACNSPICQGVINKYVCRDGDKWVQVGKIMQNKEACVILSSE